MLAERDAVVARLPGLPLTELLIESDLEAVWSKHLTHAGGAKPRVPEIEHRRNLYAAILAQACNYGTSRMAELPGSPPTRSTGPPSGTCAKRRSAQPTPT